MPGKPCCLIIFLLGNFLSAQTVIVGEVKDKLNQPLHSISIVLTKVESEAIIAYTYTDSKGRFTLSVQEEGLYTVIIDGLSYLRHTFDVEVHKGKDTIFKNLILKEEETTLDEVIVQADGPITVKKDTIIFDAAAFTMGNEVVVEDLLQNIPGLTIDDNGRISIEGKEVEKVMVDYDDFFDKGYTVLTKNMPSYAVDKIEVLQNYSNNRLLKGIENSEKVALNLSLEEDNKNVWFGDVSLGHDITGSRNYDANANLMSFGDQNKHYFLGSMNNIGLDVSGDLSYMVKPNRFNEPGTLGNDKNAVRLMDITSGSIGLKKERTNFNSVEFLSLNSIFTLTEKLKLRASGFIKTDEKEFFRSGFETFLLDKNPFTNTENYRLEKTSLDGFGQLDLTYDFSDTSMVEFSSKFNGIRNETATQLEFNDRVSTEELNGKSRLLDHKAVYWNKFQDNKVLIFTGRFIDEKIPQVYGINQLLFEDLFPEANAIEHISQSSENQMKFAGIEAQFIDRKRNDNLLELKSGFTSTSHYLNSQLLLHQDKETMRPEDYGNNITYNMRELYFNGRFTYQADPFAFITEVNAQQYFNSLDLGSNNAQSATPFLLNPKLSIEWAPNDEHKLQALVSFNSTNADILDVYNGHVLTGFRNFSRGTGQLEQTHATNYQVRYRLGNWNDSFFVNASVGYNKSYDYFSHNIIIQPNYSQVSKVLIEDREMVLSNITLERFLESISTNVKVNLGYLKSEYDHILNSEYRHIQMENYRYGAEFRSGFKGIFNFNLGTNWTYNNIQSGTSNSYTNNETFLDLNFQLNSRLNVDIESQRYNLSSFSESENNYYFLDLNAKYILKKNKLIFTLYGKNLFNTNTFRNYSINDVSIQSTEFKLLPRHLLLKATYRF